MSTQATKANETADSDKHSMVGERPIITIEVSGGVVQDVLGVPPGVVLLVVDYDNTDSGEEWGGEPCSIETHDGGPDASKAALLTERDALKAENERLRAALEKIVRACDAWVGQSTIFAIADGALADTQKSNQDQAQARKAELDQADAKD